MSYIEERTVKEAKYILKTKFKIRQAAQIFNVSKSTLHNYLKQKFPKLNPRLYAKVQKILQEHFEEKHIKGGQATKEKNAILQKLKNK